MSGRRHLTASEATAALRRGAQVEQFVGPGASEDGHRALRWLSAVQNERSYELWLHEVEDVGSDDTLDIGSDDYLDIREFDPLDPEEYVGEGRLVSQHHDPAALLQAAGHYGATAERWVNDGYVQEEYADNRRATSPGQSLVREPTGASDPANVRVQWTYAVVRRDGERWTQEGVLGGGRLPSELWSMLIDMGQRGWELVSVNGDRYYFKQEFARILDDDRDSGE